MDDLKICGPDYLAMVRLASSRLNSRRKEVNELNVFPIPDGDTGDNMYMTVRAGVVSCAGDAPLSEAASAVSRGMMLGARGNSGVILSRIFAGIAAGLENCAAAGPDDWKRALAMGVEESYKAVAKPVEGTMLTVFREAVAAAGKCGATSFLSYSDALCRAAEESLNHTPELLSVLKDAGVVDSGGAGLLYILEGFRQFFAGGQSVEPEESVPSRQDAPDLSAFSEDSVLEFGYCTEFLLRLQTSKVGPTGEFDESVIKDYLLSAGDSLVFFRDGSIIKVHVHTHTPGDILNTCQKWGEFLTLKIENMTLQHHGNHMEDKVRKGPRKKYAIVTVASGDGLVNIFRDTGADFVVEGGQTMNPSAEDFMEAFDSVNADVIYVLPNNSNIILTARQAAELFRDSDVRVIPTGSIGAGYTVLGSVDFSEGEPDAVVREAEEIAAATVTGMVSRAIRDTKDAAKGEFIGFSSGEILSHSEDRDEALFGLCSALDAGSSDVLLVFRGADVVPNDGGCLEERLQGLYPDAEIAVRDGGQPVFDYILILE